MASQRRQSRDRAPRGTANFLTVTRIISFRNCENDIRGAIRPNFESHRGEHPMLTLIKSNWWEAIASLETQVILRKASDLKGWYQPVSYSILCCSMVPDLSLALHLPCVYPFLHLSTHEWIKTGDGIPRRAFGEIRLWWSNAEKLFGGDDLCAHTLSDPLRAELFFWSERFVASPDSGGDTQGDSECSPSSKDYFRKDDVTVPVESHL